MLRRWPRAPLLFSVAIFNISGRIPALESITPDRELYEWKKDQERFRDEHPLSLELGSHRLSLLSYPRQEQDVVALFHELIGAKILKGFKFFGTSQSDRYDSLSS